MNPILATLGTKLTERIAAKLTLPGLLYLAAWIWALHTGHSRPFESGALASELDAWSEAAETRTGAFALAVALALVAATLCGLLAALIGQEVVGRLWTTRVAPAWLLEWRRSAWDRRHADRDRPPPSRYRPARLTPIGDAFRLAGERVDAQYGLSVIDAWPRLMILAGPETRDFVADSYRRYRSDATLAAWGLLVLPLAAWWWPAALAGLIGIATGSVRATFSSATLALVIESVVDAHQRDLAEALGVELSEGRLTREEGPRLNNILAKRG